MENVIGQSPAGDRGEAAARNSRAFRSRVKMFALWSAVLVPLIWGILRSFDGVGYLVPQG